MKISEQNLDLSLSKKVNYLTKITENFNPEQRGGFVAFNGKEFLLKEVATEKTSQTVLDLKEVNSLLFYLKNEDRLGIFSSSFKDDFITNREFLNENISRFSFQLNESMIIDETPYLFKRFNNVLFILSTEGNLFIIKNGLSEKIENIYEKIKINFNNLSFSIYDILDIEPISENSLLISSRFGGIMKYDLDNLSLEVKIKENGIKHMKFLEKDRLFCAGDWNIYIYNLETCLKTEKFSNLAYSFQFPNKILKDKNKLFVLGSPYGISIPDRLLHYWKEDEAGISFENADSSIAPNPTNRGIPNFIDYENDKVFLAFMKDSLLNLWIYDENNPSKFPEELKIKIPFFNNLDFFKISGEKITVADGSNMYITNIKGEILWNFKLKGNLKNIYFVENDVIIVESTGTYKIEKLSRKKSKEILLSIYSCENACNNIEILISGMNEYDKIVFLDGDTGREIRPYFTIVYKNNLVSKILDSRCKNIQAKLMLSENKNIDGIVVKRNNILCSR